MQDILRHFLRDKMPQGFCPAIVWYTLLKSKYSGIPIMLQEAGKVIESYLLVEMGFQSHGGHLQRSPKTQNT